MFHRKKNDERGESERKGYGRLGTQKDKKSRCRSKSRLRGRLELFNVVAYGKIVPTILSQIHIMVWNTTFNCLHTGYLCRVCLLLSTQRCFHSTSSWKSLTNIHEFIKKMKTISWTTPFWEQHWFCMYRSLGWTRCQVEEKLWHGFIHPADLIRKYKWLYLLKECIWNLCNIPNSCSHLHSFIPGVSQ